MKTKMCRYTETSLRITTLIIYGSFLGWVDDRLQFVIFFQGLRCRSEEGASDCVDQALA